MVSNRNILLIAYYFPPLGMGGVGRPFGLFKYLPEFGYDVTVLTVKNILYPEYDFTLLGNMDKSRIIRAGSLDPSRLMYLWGKRKKGLPEEGVSKKLSIFYFPDSKRGWNAFAFRKSAAVIQRGNISAIVTTSPPPSSHLLGLALKRKYDIPWIADFRDLWFSLPIEEVYSSGPGRKYALNLKSRIVDTADEIVTVNNDIRRYINRGEVIMNGADIDTVSRWKSESDMGRDNFVIGILGTINYLCPLEPLLRALSSLVSRDNSLRNKISIIHVGHCDQQSKDSVSRYDLGEIINLRGYLPKAKAIESLAGVDLLYFSVAAFGGYNILPRRIFDYLVSGKPIMGVAPEDSDAALLLKDYEYGTVFAEDNIGGMADYLYTMYHNIRSAGRREREGEIDIMKYSTRTMAQKYAGILDRVIKNG
jgi:hypothetical protein